MIVPKSSVLWWSSGLESTLLLAMMRGQDFDIVQIRDFWTNRQKRKADDLIKKWGLKVMSYPPISRYLIGEGDDITLVSDFGVGDARVPLLRDIVEGTQCIADMESYTGIVPDWQMNIVGSRKGDTHYALKSVIPGERWTIGKTQFWAPFYDWSRQEVIEKSVEYGLDVSEVDEQEDTGNLSACSTCFKGTGMVFCPKDQKMIKSVVWDRGKNLTVFQQSFGK